MLKTINITILKRVHLSFKNFYRQFSVDPNSTENVSSFKNNFSDQQNVKILETLNKSSPEILSKYNISLPLVQNLMNWKAKKGPFKSLEDILEVEGFGEKTLKKVAESITHQNVDESHRITPRITAKAKLNKKIKYLVIPDMNHNIFFNLNSVVAIHLEPTGVGWARLEKQNNMLTSWTLETFSALPQKMMSTDTFYLALKLLKKTPPGDAYIFEAPNNLSPQSQSKQATVTTYNQKAELISMLLALINTSVIHNPSLQNLGNEEKFKEIVNRVFYLKSNISARLFGTLIGSERVSAVTAINGLLNQEPDTPSSLPYTPVIFDNNLLKVFNTQSASNKELLAQALMLGVSFMDLYVRRNTSCFDSLKSNLKMMKP